MGPFDLGNGLFFFYSCFNQNIGYVIEHKSAWEKNNAQPQLMIIVYLWCLLIWCAVEINWHFCEKYYCSCVIEEGGRGVTTQPALPYVTTSTKSYNGQFIQELFTNKCSNDVQAYSRRLMKIVYSLKSGSKYRTTCI